MGLWNFLGGNKIGPGHPRYERELRRHNERQTLNLKNACTSVMVRGMPGAVNQLTTEEEIISVLKQFPNCPKFTDNSGKVFWGHRERDINNWKQAQQWLQEKENLEQKNIEYTKQLEQKIKDQEDHIKKLEKQSFYEKQ